MKVELVWATPNGDELVAKMARVSNPNNEDNKETAPRLINYLIRNGHWSPFEMVNACVYIECPRDISRQILRHRSFSFQEFSGRYAAYDDLETNREGRIQDHTNRQNSISIVGDPKAEKWNSIVQVIRDQSLAAYRSALDLGIAKECARAVLPEGLVPTRMYMNGTLRSWIHYFDVRCDPATQKEHREVAEAIRGIVFKEFPMIAEAVNK
jgi:thymidylate synthase (FAD)